MAADPLGELLKQQAPPAPRGTQADPLGDLLGSTRKANAQPGKPSTFFPQGSPPDNPVSVRHQTVTDRIFGALRGVVNTVETPFRVAGNLLELESRPDYAAINAANAAVGSPEAKGLTPAQAASEGLQGDLATSYRDVGQTLINRLSGRPADAPLRPDVAAANAVAGTIADFALVPSTILQVGGLAGKAGKVLKKGGDLLFDKVPLAEDARRAFSTVERGKSAPLNPVRAEARAASRQTQEALAQEWSDWNRTAQNVYKRHDLDPRTIQGLIDAPKAESEAILARQPQDVRELVERGRQIHQRGLDIEQAIGAPTFELNDVIHYAPQVMEPEFKKWLRVQGINPNDPAEMEEFFRESGVGQTVAAQVQKPASLEGLATGTFGQIAKDTKDFTTLNPFQRERLTRGVGINSLNDAIAKAHPDAPKAFIDNPALNGLIRSMSTAKNVGGAKYIDGVLATAAQKEGKPLPKAIIDRFGGQQAEQALVYINDLAKNLDMDPGALRLALKNQDPAVLSRLPESQRSLAEQLGRMSQLLDRYDAMKAARFDPEVLGAIKRYVDAQKPENVGRVLEAYDNYLAMWKNFTLAPVPSYHLRNMMSNVWQNFLAGLSNPIRYQQALDVQRGAPITLKLGDKKWTTADLLKSAADEGVTNAGFFGEEIKQSADDLAAATRASGKTGAKKVLSQVGHGAKRGFGLIDKGFAFQRATENNARLALYIDQLAKGKTPEQAAATVKKYLFDYSDLTPFERQKMKRIFPFYSWSRFNIPLAIETAITQPGKVAGLQKAVSSVNQAFGAPPPEQVPPYARSAIFLGTDQKGNPVYANLGGIFGTQQLQDFGAGEAARQGVSQASPLLGLLPQLGFNRYGFSGRPIAEEGDVESLAGQPVPAEVKFLLTQIAPGGRILGNVSRAVENYQKGESKALPAVLQALGVNPLSPYGVDLQQTAFFRGKDFQDFKYQLTGAIRSAQRDGDLAKARVLQSIFDSATPENWRQFAVPE